MLVIRFLKAKSLFRVHTIFSPAPKYMSSNKNTCDPKIVNWLAHIPDLLPYDEMQHVLDKNEEDKVNYYVNAFGRQHDLKCDEKITQGPSTIEGEKQHKPLSSKLVRKSSTQKRRIFTMNKKNDRQSKRRKRIKGSNVLQEYFLNVKRRPNKEEREHLAFITGLKVTQVNDWFGNQNRRKKKPQNHALSDLAR